MLTLTAIARALDGEVIGRDTVRAPGPNHSAKDRSLTVKLSATAPDGFVCHSFCGDGWRECRDHVRQRLGLGEWQPGQREDRRTVDPAHIGSWDLGTTDKESDEMRPRTEDDLQRIARAQALWNEAGDPRGTAAEQYLASRSLTLFDDLCGGVLRYHHNTPWRNEDTGNVDKVPCLLACFRSIDDDTVTAVHRIRVDQHENWPKTERRMMGVVTRSAIKLTPAGDELMVGEGLETCMSPREAGLTMPCWALGSAGAISRLPVLPGVRKLMLAAEMSKEDTTKPNWASEKSIYVCRLRWHRAGRKTSILKPSHGDDLNAALMHMKTTGAAA